MRPWLIAADRGGTFTDCCGIAPDGSRRRAKLLSSGRLRARVAEVGIAPEGVSVLGVLPEAHVAASGFDVTSVVGWWPAPRPLVPVDTFEVAAVHSLALGHLVDPANRLTWTHPSGYRGPAFVVDDLFVWGFTGHLLDGLVRLAGWEKPWDVRRTAPIPPRFLRGRDDNGR